MSDNSPPVPLEKARESTIQTLGEHFAHDNLDAEQLERRLDQAFAATSLQELRALVSDLPALQTGTAVAAQRAPVEQVRDQQAVIAIMGGASRKGSWVPPRHLYVVAVMGGAELDFRDARFGPGIVEITVFALMGGVEITVPPDVNVEVNGVALMGGFEERAGGAPADPSAPLLRIGGFALMGGVEVRTRHRGETKRDARDRERLERKEARRLRRGE
jgi:hypothetical protein